MMYVVGTVPAVTHVPQLPIQSAVRTESFVRQCQGRPLPDNFYHET